MSSPTRDDETRRIDGSVHIIWYRSSGSDAPWLGR